MNSAQKHRNNKIAKAIYSSTPKFVNDLIFSGYGMLKYKEYLSLKKGHLQELKRVDGLSKEEIRKIQEEKFKKLIAHAYSNTDYYKKIIDDAGIDPQNARLEDLEKFPVLTKDILLAKGSDLQAKNKLDFKPVQQSSGGTTGTTVNFLMDKENYLFKEAEVLLYWERHGYQPRSSKTIMYRAGVLFPDDGKVPKKPWRIDNGRRMLYLSSYYSSEEYYKKYYEKLKSWKPEFMHVLPSAGYLFATYLNQNNLTIPLKKVFTASEMLYPTHREAMEKAFECKVLDHYGHGEPGIYAAGQCDNGNYHICESNVIVERDEDGSIIETALNNYSMPFIRYKVGDKIKSLSDEICGCGSMTKYITGIVGRESEIIYTGDGRKISSIGFDQIFKNNNIKMGQVVQEKKGELELKIVPTESFNDANKASLIGELQSRVGTSTKIHFNKVDDIPRAKSGKYNLIISKIK